MSGAPFNRHFPQISNIQYLLETWQTLLKLWVETICGCTAWVCNGWPSDRLLLVKGFGKWVEIKGGQQFIFLVYSFGLIFCSRAKTKSCEQVKMIIKTTLFGDESNIQCVCNYPSLHRKTKYVQLFCWFLIIFSFISRTHHLTGSWID